MSDQFGIKVAKRSKRTPDTASPRENAQDTSQKDLTFNTQLNTFKFVTRGIKRIPGGSTTPTHIIPHSLSYMPSFQLYSRSDAGVIKQVTYDGGSAGPNIVPWVDKTNLYVLIHGGEGDFQNQAFDLIYYIGADDLENPDT